jgi:hypothetical protein
MKDTPNMPKIALDVGRRVYTTCKVNHNQISYIYNDSITIRLDVPLDTFRRTIIVQHKAALASLPTYLECTAALSGLIPTVVNQKPFELLAKGTTQLISGQAVRSLVFGGAMVR